MTQTNQSTASLKPDIETHLRIMLIAERWWGSTLQDMRLLLCTFASTGVVDK
jgi:hypothetical protein